MKNQDILVVTLALALIPVKAVGGPISPCPLGAAALPPAMTQLGLNPDGAVEEFNFSGAGTHDSTVVIFDPSGSGDPIGTASAHAGTAGCSKLTTVTGGMLSSFGAVSATAAVTIDPDFAAPAFAHSMFDFWLQLAPPAGTTGLVPLTITDLFDVSFVLGGGSGEAIVTATAIRGPSQPVLFSDEFVFVSPGGMSVPHPLMVMANEIMKIHMEAKANEFAQAGGIASAVADPTFQIDPNFPGADSFGFAVSPELVPGAIPEPATGLLVLPLAGLFILLRRRRRLSSKPR